MNVADAAARWRQMIDEREAQTNALRTLEGGAGFWDQCAETFARVSRGFQSDRLFELMVARLKPGMSVLDVGAGTGRYAVPLAKAGAEVIAVEPSPTMRQFLEETAREEGVSDRIRVLAEPWPQADAPVADLVLCSHVVYGIREIVPFLERLQASARDAVFLSVRVTQFDANVLDLWQRLHGVERQREPVFFDLYSLLYAMGTVANVELMPFGARRGQGPGGGFATEEEALEAARRILFARPDPVADAVIRGFLAERMTQRDGRLVWSGPGMRAAAVWWTVGPS